MRQMLKVRKADDLLLDRNVQIRKVQKAKRIHTLDLPALGIADHACARPIGR